MMQLNIQNIGLYGGEPFLPHTRSVIKHIVSRAPSTKYSATTNGYYLTEFLDILNSVEVSQITVTLDGTKEIHNKTRILRDGRPTYERILQGVELSLQSNKRIKIRMNISPENVNDCMNLREELIIKYSTYYNSGNLTFELQSLFQLSDAQKKILNEQNVMRPNCAILTEIYETLPKLYANYIRSNKRA